MRRIVGVVLLLALSCLGQSQEQPTTLPTRITHVHFLGVSAMPMEKLDALARSYEDHLFAASKIDAAYNELIERVREAFQDEGFWGGEAEFDPTLDSDGPQEREVSVAVTLREGPKYLLSSLQWEGVHHFDSGTLNSTLGIQVPDTFHRNEIAKALEQLRRMYAKEGFLMMVAIPRTEVDHQALTIAITVDVEEDQQYRFGSFRVYPGVRAVDSRRVASIWSGFSGVIYSEKAWKQVAGEAEKVHLYLNSSYDRTRHVINAELMPPFSE